MALARHGLQRGVAILALLAAGASLASSGGVSGLLLHAAWRRVAVWHTYLQACLHHCLLPAAPAVAAVALLVFWFRGVTAFI